MEGRERGEGVMEGGERGEGVMEGEKRGKDRGKGKGEIISGDKRPLSKGKCT